MPPPRHSTGDRDSRSHSPVAPSGGTRLVTAALSGTPALPGLVAQSVVLGLGLTVVPSARLGPVVIKRRQGQNTPRLSLQG